MKTEQKLLTLTFSEQAQENYHVLRMVDDNGEELTWQMHGFITDLCPSMYFPTEEQYMEHVHQWEEIFEFPSWEDIAIPGVGACLAPWGADLTFKEIHQWLYDILFEMRSHLDGFEVENRILIDTGLSKEDDSNQGIDGQIIGGTHRWGFVQGYQIHDTGNRRCARRV